MPPALRLRAPRWFGGGRRGLPRRGRRGRACDMRGTCLLTRGGAQRVDLPLERDQGFGRDPYRRLRAGARVANTPVGSLQRLQVVDRRARTLELARLASGGDEALNREGRRLSVRISVGHLGEAAVGPLRL